jgi:hypothetical protein
MRTLCRLHQRRPTRRLTTTNQICASLRSRPKLQQSNRMQQHHQHDRHTATAVLASMGGVVAFISSFTIPVSPRAHASYNALMFEPYDAAQRKHIHSIKAWSRQPFAIHIQRSTTSSLCTRKVKFTLAPAATNAFTTES